MIRGTCNPLLPLLRTFTNNTSSTIWKETPKKVSIAVEKVTKKKEIRNTIYFLLPITVEPITYVGIICNVEWYVYSAMELAKVFGL